MESVSDAQLSNILKTLRLGLKKILRDELDAVYLFGSRARGDYQSDSDIDVLIVLCNDFSYFDMVMRTSELSAELSLKYDVVISKVFVTRHQFENQQSPLLINIHKEGVPV